MFQILGACDMKFHEISDEIFWLKFQAQVPGGTSTSPSDRTTRRDTAASHVAA
jgi:hypothetical protein